MPRSQREQLPGQLKGAVAVDRERVEHLVAAEPDEYGALLAAVGPFAASISPDAESRNDHQRTVVVSTTWRVV